MADAIIEGIRDRVSVAIKVNQSVGIQVPVSKHTDLLEAVFSYMTNNPKETWVFVTSSFTFDYLSRTYKDAIDKVNVKFIDCISRYAGVPKRDKRCNYVESPTMLEKTSLEIINSFQGVKEDAEKYLIIDSLSALMIHNDSRMIREFVSLLMSRARSENIHIASILIEEEMDSHEIIQLNDKIVVLRDSFID